MTKKWPGKKNNELTLKEAGKLIGTTPHAIHGAIHRRRIPAQKKFFSPKQMTWIIKKEDLEKYRNSRFDRKFATHNGKLIFDKDKGLYSVKETAQILNLKCGDLYYLLRKGEIKSHRSGKKQSIFVISLSDILEFKSAREKERKVT